MSLAKVEKIYFPALDSLRFFASLNIVLLHFSSSSLFSCSDGTIFEPVLKAPFFNTNLFFILSGFIYSVLFSERIPKFGPFIKERFWRLYPLHLVCTLIIFAITIYRTHLLDNPAYAAKTLALHISLLWAFVPEMGHHLNQPSWTLAVFFLCYALTPAFLRFLGKLRKNYVIWLLFLGSWAALLAAVLYFKSLPNVFRGITFFSGVLLGELFLRKAVFLPKKAILNDFFLILSGILLYVSISYYSYYIYIIPPLLYCAFVLFLANNRGFIVKILSFSWLRAVGRSSFYVYLLHCVVIEMLHLYLDKVTYWKYNPFNNLAAAVVIIALLYGICTVYSLAKRRKEKKLLYCKG